MRSFERGCALADELGVGPGAELRPVLEHLDLEVEPWRFAGRVREVIVERTIGIDDRLSEPWVRWLTAHAVGHHLLHTGTSLYVESWQWVARLKARAAGRRVRGGVARRKPRLADGGPRRPSVALRHPHGEGSARALADRALSLGNL